MPSTPIPRAVIQDAIAYAVSRVDFLPDEAAAALTEVGRTCTEIGAAYADGPGCPLVQAGLVRPPFVIGEPMPDWATDFVLTYDCHLHTRHWNVARDGFVRPVID